MSPFASMRYADGDGHAVVADGVVVLLPSSARALAVDIWTAVDDGADFDGAVDVLVRGGIAAIGDVAIAGWRGGALRVLVRGAARARVSTPEGVQSLEAAPGTIWTERLLDGASGLELDLGTSATAESPAPRGVLRVSALALANVQRQSSGAPATEPVAALVFSTGDHVEVDRVILVGRSPETHRFASHEETRVVTVPSPHQEISGTHLEVRPGSGADHGSAIVTDLGSTNGTVLVQPGLPAESLTPGIAVSLVPGAVLDLGDGVTAQVTNPLSPP